MANLTALISGLLFGMGLALSQMINPAKVLGFLDFAGDFDPSLALVMVGAVATLAALQRWVLRRPAPLLEERFHLPTKRAVDRQLIAGAAIFGIGWGLAGFCPGPALAAFGQGELKTGLFLAAMIAGFGFYEAIQRLRR